MNRPAILVAVLVVAFGAAFGIGKATAGGSDDSGGAKKAAKADVASSEVDAPELSTAGNLPALRVKRPTPAASGGGGGSSSGQAATQPSTPSAPSAPSAPSTPSAPATPPKPSPPAGGCDNC